MQQHYKDSNTMPTQPRDQILVHQKTVLSCILLVIATSHTTMHGSMNIKNVLIVDSPIPSSTFTDSDTLCRIFILLASLKSVATSKFHIFHLI